MEQPKIARGPKSVETGPKSVETGPKSVEAGPKSVEAGPKSVETGPKRIKECYNLRPQQMLISEKLKIVLPILKKDKEETQFSNSDRR